jgi:hypothetical protein
VVHVHTSCREWYMYIPLVGSGTCTYLLSGVVHVHTSCREWYMYIPLVRSGTCTYLLSEVVHVHTSCLEAIGESCSLVLDFQSIV